MKGLTKQEWFYRWRLTFSPCSSFLTVLSLVLHLVKVSVTTHSTWRYLDPSEVVLVVQLLQDATSIKAIARGFAVSPNTVSGAWRKFQETGCYSRRAGEGFRRSISRTTKQSQTSWGWPENLMSSRGLCAHWLAPLNLIGICHRAPQLAGLPQVPWAFHRCKQF